MQADAVVIFAVNGTRKPLLNIQFCEGKYGGPIDGVQPLGIHLPEHLNAWTGLFILWCGLHQLLFNQHDSALLKVIAGHFVLNGACSFLYHSSGYDSYLTIDGYLMMSAVWLATGFILEELTAHMAETAPWNQPLQRRHVCRRLVRATYWVLVLAVPSIFLLALEQPWRNLIENISPYFIGAFVTPLLLMLTVILLLMFARDLEDEASGAFPDAADGTRTFGRAKRRFFYGLTSVLLGVGAWLLSEGLCDTYDAFKLLPGHAIFHVLMAYGLTQCLVYPSILRARSYGAHARFVAESAALQPVAVGRCWHRMQNFGRRVARGYLFLFPAISFVSDRSSLPMTTKGARSSTSDLPPAAKTSEQQPTLCDRGVTPHAVAPPAQLWDSTLAAAHYMPQAAQPLPPPLWAAGPVTPPAGVSQTL